MRVGTIATTGAETFSVHGERGRGRTVVLGHALTLDRTTLAEVAGILARSHHVVTWDARGHGSRPAPDGPFSHADLADDVADLLDELNIARAVVGGVSQGAFVAIELAVTQPERVEGLVLISCQAHPEPPEVVPPQREAVRRWATEGLDAGHARWMAEMNFGPGHPLASSWVDRWTSQDGGRYVEAFEALFSRPDRTRDLAGLDAPTVVVRGEHDGWISASAAAELAAGLPRAGDVVTIPGAAHVPTATHPVETAAVIDDFLRI